MSLRSHSLVGWTLLALVGAGFAAWQLHGFRHERDLAQHALVAQTEAIAQCLFAGIRSHRRMGRFFNEQIQDVVDQLVATASVRAALVEDDHAHSLASAGETQLLQPGRTPLLWQDDGLQVSRPLEVTLEEPRGGGGGGGGFGGGGGGRGPAWLRDATSPEPEAGPQTFLVTLLADRRAADLAVQQAAQLRLTSTLAGLAALVGVAWAWRAQAQSWRTAAQATLLEAESQRWRDLAQAAAGLAHETRNPLGVIRGNLQALAQQTPDAASRAQTARLIEECDRVTSRINQFLAFARVPAPQFQDVAVGPLVQTLEALLEPDLDQHRLRIVAQDDVARLVVRADPEHLRQMLFNLLQNAIAFAPPGGEVRVCAAYTAHGPARLEVVDQGPGVLAEHRDQLFSPYFTTRPGGAGLGLALVRRLAEAQGWRAGYAPHAGGGACFYLEGMDVCR